MGQKSKIIIICLDASIAKGKLHLASEIKHFAGENKVLNLVISHCTLCLLCINCVMLSTECTSNIFLF